MSLPSLKELELFLPTFDEQDEFSKNLSLAKFIHLSEQKANEVGYVQKKLIFCVIEQAKIKFTNEALRAYFQKRQEYKIEIATNKARPDAYFYAAACNPLAPLHIHALLMMKERFLSIGAATLVGEMKATILFSYLGLRDEAGILAMIKEIQGAVKQAFWTIAEESFDHRNQIKALPLSTLFKIREFYDSDSGLEVFIRKLSNQEKAEAVADSGQSEFERKVNRMLLEHLRSEKIL